MRSIAFCLEDFSYDKLAGGGALPAPILGFGLVYALIKLLHSLSDLYHPNRPRNGQSGIDRNEKSD